MKFKFKLIKNKNENKTTSSVLCGVSLFDIC